MFKSHVSKLKIHHGRQEEERYPEQSVRIFEQPLHDAPDAKDNQYCQRRLYGCSCQRPCVELKEKRSTVSEDFRWEMEVDTGIIRQCRKEAGPFKPPQHVRIADKPSHPQNRIYYYCNQLFHFVRNSFSASFGSFTSAFMNSGTLNDFRRQ